MIYTDISQVLRRRGRYYQIIAPELVEFFGPHGDYHWHYRDRDALNNSSGGNAWNWSLKTVGKRSIVELSFQFGDEEPIRLDLRLFNQMVKLLGDSRNLETERRKP